MLVAVLVLAPAHRARRFFCTTNGTPPTTSSTQYTGPLTISSSSEVVVSALGVAPGLANSGVAQLISVTL
ncbi:MAG: chitobiase/beta-hexosaminidase C-terminal domain-containing protein [Steroidobacteraceae bacterium]